MILLRWLYQKYWTWRLHRKLRKVRKDLEGLMLDIGRELIFELDELLCKIEDMVDNDVPD